MGGIRGRCVLCLALPDTWALGQVRCSEASYNLGPSPQKEEARCGFVCLRSPLWGTEAGGGGLSRRTPCLAGVEGSAPLPGPSPSRLPGCRCLRGVLGGSGLADAPPASTSLASGPPSSPRGHRPPVRPSASHARRDPASRFQTRSRAQAPGPGLERVSGGQFGP